MTPTIEATGLRKRFGKTVALDGLDLVAEPGQVLAVLGPNGAGKTTFVRTVATLLRPDAGELRVAGHDVRRQPGAVRRVIGLAGQYAAVEPAMTGRENLRLVARLFGQDRRAARASSDRVLELLGLTGAADRLARITMATMAKYRHVFPADRVLDDAGTGGLALVLTLSGLFSVLSYLVEQRRKEIGVRMALGASARSIASLMVSQLARPVAVGLLVGAACAAALGIVLLSIPDAALIADVVHLLDPVAYVATVVCIVAGCAVAALIPAARAARVDPVATLRAD